MCGKAPPYRESETITPLSASRLSLEAEKKLTNCYGKAEPFRTSGGEAAENQSVDSLAKIIDSYDADAPLAEAATIPSAWYTDQRIFAHERQTVFSDSWQFAARVDQLPRSGDFVTTEIAGEPIVIVRGSDNELRGFFNVCRHHAAAVMTEPEGRVSQMRCPYHGWTYSLEGELKGTPDFSGVCNFEKADHGLVPVCLQTWEQWLFVRIGDRQRAPLKPVAEDVLQRQIQTLGLANLHWFERRRYELKCNWKVFVDNYLDGGYHVPHLHQGLDSVLDYSNYTTENGDRFCLQSSPMVAAPDAHLGAVRSGPRALYYWLYPNFMINYYEGTLDTNLVRPLGLDRTEVI